MKLGFTCSCWDLLHAGHILFLKECKENCDRLIVGIQSDPTIDRPEKNAPIESLEERILKIEAIKYIDNFFVYDTEADLYQYLVENEVGIDLRFLGSDYLNKKFTGDDLDIKIFYHHREHNYSSTDLRKRIVEKNENIKHSITIDSTDGV